MFNPPDITSISGDVSAAFAMYCGSSDFRLFNIVWSLRNATSDSELTMLMSGVISFTLDGAKTQATLKIGRLMDSSFENLDFTYCTTGLTLSFP